MDAARVFVRKAAHSYIYYNNLPQISEEPCSRKRRAMKNNNSRSTTATTCRVVYAGPLSLSLCSGEIRNLSFGDQEIVRRVYVAIRDKYWNTVKPELSGLRIRKGRNTLKAEFTCRHKRGLIDFEWQGLIEGDKNGRVSFAMSGTANSSFETNRISICVLLPLAQWQGKRCAVELTTGKQTVATLPGKIISPHQPLKNVRVLRCKLKVGLQADLQFEGDTFEMEDQRNWTDASFKFYCPPLIDNIPFRIKKDQSFFQKVLVLTNTKTMHAAPAQNVSPLQATRSKKSYYIPEIGLVLSASSQKLSLKVTRLIQSAAVSHMRADIRFDNNDWQRSLRSSMQKSIELQLPLELAVHFQKDPAVLARDASLLAKEIAVIGVSPVRCIVHKIGEKVTPQETLAAFRKAFPKMETVVGTDGYFVEINRKSPPWMQANAVCYSANPQVHTFDDAAVMDNIYGQHHVLSAARALFPNKKIVVSPITFRPRFNPLSPHKDHGPDPRQKTLFGAAWTLGSIIQSACGGASSVTYFETFGDYGIMESGGARVFPMYHVFADIGEFAAGRLRPLEGGRERGVTGCLLEKEGRSCFLIANLTPARQTIAFASPSQAMRCRVLCGKSVARACAQPMAFRQESGRTVYSKAGNCSALLDAYTVLRLDKI